MLVSYFAYDGAPGRYFRCDRYGVMSTNSCSQNYAAAPEASREGRLAGCVGCAIGAEHSGGALVPLTAKPDGWCVRCRRAPEGYNTKGGARGMGRVRLVNGGRCVSCVNREYEVEKGANAKGVPPKKWAGLGPQFVTLIENGRLTVIRERRAVDRIEVGLVAMRRSPRPMVMCWTAPPMLPPLPLIVSAEQLTLFEPPGPSRPPLRAAPKLRPAGPAIIEQSCLFEALA